MQLIQPPSSRWVISALSRIAIDLTFPDFPLLGGCMNEWWSADQALADLNEAVLLCGNTAGSIGPLLPPVFIPSTTTSSLSQDSDLHFQEREASLWWRLKDHLWVLWYTFQIKYFKGGEIIARFVYLMDLEM